MSEEERKTIGELLKEYYNRPLELIEENQKLKKKIDKLQKDSISKDKIRNKIKELEKEMEKISEVNWKEEQIDILEELLGE